MGMASTGWVLSERAGLSAGPEFIGEALQAKRRRFASYLGELPPSAWSAPSRCSAWSVHSVARHVVDGAEIDAALLGGRPPLFAMSEPFDPTRTPQQWLAASDGQTPDATLDALHRAIEDEHDCFARRIATGDDETMAGATGRPTHWSVVTTHIFWDAWLHERDVLVPIGVEPGSIETELRLATLYGLLVAATPAAMIGDPLDVAVALEGGADDVYAVTFGEEGVTVAVDNVAQPSVRGHALPVLDALMGRGPAVADVLEGEAEVIEKLSWLRQFMAPDGPG